MTAPRPAAADAVLQFWFDELTPEDRFRDVLGRHSTPEKIEFLTQPGSAF